MLKGVRFEEPCSSEIDLFGKGKGLSRLFTELGFSVSEDNLRPNNVSGRVMMEYIGANDVDSRLFNMSALYRVYRGDFADMSDEQIKLISDHLEPFTKFALEAVEGMYFDPSRPVGVASGFGYLPLNINEQQNQTRVRVSELVSLVATKIGLAISRPEGVSLKSKSFVGRELGNGEFVVNPYFRAVFEEFAQGQELDGLSFDDFLAAYRGELLETRKSSLLRSFLDDFRPFLVGRLGNDLVGAQSLVDQAYSNTFASVA